MKTSGVHGKRKLNVFVVPMVAASCQRSKASLQMLISTPVVVAQHQLKIRNKILRTALVVLSSKVKKCKPAIGMQRKEEEKKYLNAAKSNWWKYIYLCSFLYIQYIFYFGQIQSGKGFMMLLQAYVKDEMGEFQKNKMLNLASGETFQLREPLGWNNHLK